MAVLNQRFLRYVTGMIDGAKGTPDEAWRHDLFVQLMAPDLSNTPGYAFGLSGRETAA